MIRYSIGATRPPRRTPSAVPGPDADRPGVDPLRRRDARVPVHRVGEVGDEGERLFGGQRGLDLLVEPGHAILQSGSILSRSDARSRGRGNGSADDIGEVVVDVRALVDGGLRAVGRRELQPGGHRCPPPPVRLGDARLPARLPAGPSSSPGRRRVWVAPRRTPSPRSGRGWSSSVAVRTAEHGPGERSSRPRCGPVPSRRRRHGLARVGAGGGRPGARRPRPGSTSWSTTPGRSSRNGSMGPDGIESTLATLVVGPFALVSGLLQPATGTAGSRVVAVTSGGMYTQRLRHRRPLGTSESYSGPAGLCPGEARPGRARPRMGPAARTVRARVGRDGQRHAPRLGRHPRPRRVAAELPSPDGSAPAEPGRRRRHDRLAGRRRPKPDDRAANSSSTAGRDRSIGSRGPGSRPAIVAACGTSWWRCPEHPIHSPKADESTGDEASDGSRWGRQRWALGCRSGSAGH